MGWTPPKDWTDGEIVTEENMDTHVKDNLTFLGDTHDHSGDSGDGAAVTRGIFVQAGAVYGAGATDRQLVGLWPETSLADGGDGYAIFVFRLPTYYTSVSKLVALLRAGVAGNEIYRHVDISATAHNEAGSGTHAGTTLAGTVTMTASAILEDDISSALHVDISAGDYISVTYRREGAHVDDNHAATCGLVGIYVEFK
tara:strand:+ start:2286 stop:2879 length:594 start_codon:yes stop_codon:yes gene_type:complete